MSSVEQGSEKKESLYVGDPEAGYVDRDMSGVFDTGTVPDVEQDAYDANVEEREKQVKAIEDSEDAVVKRRRDEAEKQTKSVEADTSVSAQATGKSTKASSSSAA
jgi:hypothetical protein